MLNVKKNIFKTNMLNYKKGKNIEEELNRNNIPIENLPNDFLWMQVKGGTKIPNVVEFAKKALDKNEHSSIVWSGSGGGVQKTISCAEIMRRHYDLHQITRICYRKVEEYWDPENEELEEIVAKREIPCVHILQSLNEINSKSLGYQYGKNKTTFWIDKKPESSSSTIKKSNKKKTNKN